MIVDPSAFTEQSDWLELAEALDCCEIGQEVIVYGKINVFRGVIECVKPNCTHIQIKYDATESGYPDTHTLESCDVTDIRCKLCCDNNYYQVDCSVDPIDLSGLPDYPPEGQVFLYGGDLNNPDCLYMYQGFGPFKDITSYIPFGSIHIIDFELDGYDLTITRSDGTEFTVTLASESLASICFDSIKLDCDTLDELA